MIITLGLKDYNGYINMTELSTHCLATALKMSYLLSNRANVPYKCLDFQKLGIRCHPQVKDLIKDYSGHFRFLPKALATGKICVVASQLA